MSNFGLGLRIPFYKEAAAGKVPVDWFEIISENFMVAGGNPLVILDAVRSHYPVAMHGVSLNLGGTDPIDQQYLNQLANLVKWLEPDRVSDHLCWTRQGQHCLHDLLPLPYTEESIKHVAQRIRQVQDSLGRHVLIENVSSYAEFNQSICSEAEFFATVAKEADCHLLLDINNIIVSAHNHGFDANEYIQHIPFERVKQVHLAGHTVNEITDNASQDSIPLYIDTHDHPVADYVWAFYEKTVPLYPNVPTMIERDDNIPPLEELLQELDHARQISRKALAA